MRLGRRTFLSAGLAALAAAAGGQAGAATDPRAFVADLGQQAIAVIVDKSLGPEQREERLGQILEGNFDLPLISRLALGISYRQLDDGQRAEYQKLFADYVRATYADRFSTYSGQRFEATSSQTLGDGDIVVASRIVPPTGEPIKVDWRVRLESGKPQIIDVVVAGVSLVVTQRNEFQAVVQSKGVDGLLALLRQRIAQARPS